MNEDEQPSMLYHSRLKRWKRKRGLAIAFVFACGVIAAGMSFVEVEMPQPVLPRGEAEIYYRNDELIHFQIRQRTPLPLDLPAYADPVRRENAAIIDNDGRAVARPALGPAFDFLFVPPDSIVLGEADLLALPPEDATPAPAKTPDKAETGDASTQGKEDTP